MDVKTGGEPGQVTILAGATAFPPHHYSQDQIVSALKERWAERHFNLARLEQLHKNVAVEGRHLAVPLERYNELEGFGANNDAWIKVAVDLGEEALRQALGRAEVEPADVGQLVFTTVTGLAVPSVDARLMNRLPFRHDLKRLPLFGLGCVAGAAGLARVNDYLVGHPGEAAALLSVELCSLTLQRRDFSIANIISSGLFGDGAAALVAVGAQHPLAGMGNARVVATRSRLWPETERVMGWDVTDAGLKVVLGPEVPDIARERMRPFVEEFLADHGLVMDQIHVWVAHPGGPRVVDAMEEGLGLEAGALDASRESLARVGNLSSASVLALLDETLQRSDIEPGTWGLMLAMGPGFCAEAVLLRW